MESNGLIGSFVQWNHSYSTTRNAARSSLQLPPHAEAKYLRCVAGAFAMLS